VLISFLFVQKKKIISLLIFPICVYAQLLSFGIVTNVISLMKFSYISIDFLKKKVI